MFWQFLSAFYLHGRFSSGEVWFEEGEIAGSILTLFRNFVIGDVGLNVAPSARHCTYMLPAEATAVVMAISKLIFMAPTQSPNCTTGRIPFEMRPAPRN